MKALYLTTVVLGLSIAPLAALHATGAIAVNDQEGRSASQVGYGISTNKDSRREAEVAAMRACRARNDSCKVVVWFEQCGAYASSREHSGIGYGNSERVARAKALDDCGTDRCRIVISGCDD